MWFYPVSSGFIRLYPVILGKLDFRKIKVLLLDTIGYYLILVDTGRGARPEARNQSSEVREIFSRQGVF